MVLAIRDVREHDLEAVLALNNAAGAGILSMSEAHARHLYDIADYFRVAEVDGKVAGFLIAVREDADHDSPNFLWFRERYEQFVYIDRIVVGSGWRRHGLGRVFYCDVQSFAEVRVPHLACEVFLEPRDDATLLFHGTYGFQEVGQQVMPGNQRRVSMQAKALPSFDYVRDTYGHALPAQPWLSEREHIQQRREASA
ncbi:GNAT family N-acetyltransferase [Oleiagrimonas sp. C23AA]|uniref:GNAT family N-acetyltransferase n=1 Tax=Oleiagrimonas sp. C23AA TaxID=2719047 RepID=UPI0014238550|nr:GNAT family N-acetyltransferase [Oleiagrimonas sp. C23AA]NII11672.1 GNAT family N-acetyltransferase [Oleiagrimonas sp. C23AA]